MKKMLRTSFLILFLFGLQSCEQNNSGSHKQINPKKSNSNTTNIPTNTVKPKVENTKFIETKKISTLISPNSGTIEWLVREGKSFKKDECILRYDNTKQFLKISQLKVALQAKLSNFILNFPPELESRKTIWAEFASNLTPDKLTPKLPIEFKEEYDFCTKNSTILSEYEELIKEEGLMKDYFVLSKKSGKIQKWNVKQGSKVSKNSTLALIEYD